MTCRFIPALVNRAVFFFLFTVPATTYGTPILISPTGGVSNGNPGGQPLFQVSNLMQGDSFGLSWGGVTGLSVVGTVSITSLTSTNVVIGVSLTNNSPLISGTDPRVTSFGVLVPNFTSLGSASTGGTYLTLADDSNFPGFATTVCGASGNNCAGGGPGGIPSAGGSDSFSLNLNGSFGVTPSLTLSNFAIKIQGGPSGASFELAGLPQDSSVAVVPEPASLLLMGSGLLGLGWSRRRRS